MTDDRTATMIPGSSVEQAASDVPKRRNCLRCKSSFKSEWSGERICAKCKVAKSWRLNEPLKRRQSETSRREQALKKPQTQKH